MAVPVNKNIHMPNHNIAKLERNVNALMAALSNLGSAQELKELLKTIRRPGWTTPAEFIFASGIVDSMTIHTKVLIGLEKTLLKGSNAVKGG